MRCDTVEGWRCHKASPSTVKACMTMTTMACTMTGERMMSKDTGGRNRPSRDEIARLAYLLYERRGRREGCAVDDWLSAERELTHHYR